MSWTTQAAPSGDGACSIDFDRYQPGDVFATVFAGLPGFEQVETPDRRAAGPAAAGVATADAGVATADAGAVADAGFRGAPTSLPHRAVIQASFGRHDVSNLEAFVGGPARDASHSLDAEAYAAGGKVAFADAPDLHTAAHEAAHAIQQRSAGSTRAGISTPDDSLEHHADAVAALVVAGQSAEALLSAAPSGTGIARVQRKAKSQSEAHPTRQEQCEGNNGPLKTLTVNDHLGELSNIGLSFQQSQQVEFAIDSEDNVIAVSAEIDPRSNAWIGSEELAAMWDGHVKDVSGFIFNDTAYRFTDAGTFEVVTRTSTKRGHR